MILAGTFCIPTREIRRRDCTSSDVQESTHPVCDPSASWFAEARIVRSPDVPPQGHRRAPAAAGWGDGVVFGRGGRLVDELNCYDACAADVVAVMSRLPDHEAEFSVARRVGHLANDCDSSCPPSLSTVRRRHAMLNAMKFWTPLVLLVVAGCASTQSAGDGAPTQPGTEGGMTSIYSFSALDIRQRH